MNPKIQKSMPIILSIASIIGIGATSYLVAKETEKNIDKLRDSKSNKKLYLKTVLKTYAPAIAVGSATIASITAGTIIGKKTEASLSATCIMLDQSLRKYKTKVKEKIGEKADEIEKSIMEDDYKEIKDEIKEVDDGLRLYYEEHIGFFKAIPEKFQAAITKMNERILSGESYCSLRMFLEDMDAEILDKTIDNVSYDYGWTLEYIQDAYVRDGYYSSFVHPKTQIIIDDVGELQYYEVSFDIEPIFGVTDIMKYNGYTPKELEKIQEYCEHDREMTMKNFTEEETKNEK